MYTGTICRTDCGCISSSPAPSPADATTPLEYGDMYMNWEDEWELEAGEHTRQCPKSAYYDLVISGEID